jgi:hypothetical protein
MIKDSVLFALSSGFSVSLFHFYMKKKSTRVVLFCICSFFSLHRSLYLLLANCLYWRLFRSRDLSFNLFPVGSHSLGHVICLLIYLRLAYIYFFFFNKEWYYHIIIENIMVAFSIKQCPSSVCGRR